MSSSASDLMFFGFGFTARVLAGQLAGSGRGLRATVRDPAKAGELAALGIAAVPFAPADPAALDGVGAVLVSAGPRGSGEDPVLPVWGAALAAHAGSIGWLGYLSATSVYGDHRGGWVDEATPPTPQTDMGHQRLAAENAWLAFGAAHGIPVHFFRIAGIYGPGRNPLEDLRKGRARRVDKPGQVFSRIHVEDLAAVLAASLARPRAGAIYNVCDDLPCPAHEVVAHAAGLLGVEPPPLRPLAEMEPTMSPLARAFWMDCKRVRNDRIKRELGVVLRHPDYRAGLAAILAAERTAAAAGQT